MARRARWSLLVLLLAAALLAAAAARPGPDSADGAPSDPAASPAEAAGDDRPRWPVTIRRPEGPPRIEVDRLDGLGRPVTLACSACHDLRRAEPVVQRAADLRHFHQGLVLEHGGLSCLSCHHGDDYDRLRRADGSPLEYAEVMTLCGQCHGSQARDYAHGAHGGMHGFWDLSRGPRFRLGCIDCHDPHAPAFAPMVPTFKPVDRFLSPGHGPGEDGHE